MKRLLIITQVVDQDHPILGFFHGWITECAKHCAVVHVISLQVGRYDLPANVHVHSLGKENGVGRFRYVWRFYKLIFSLRHDYDGVFVHMNQIYVVLGGVLWRWWGKRIGLWYMHGTASLSLKVAEKITQHVFTGTAASFPLISKKIIVTGHGIDTHLFKPDSTVTPAYDFVTVGRITPSKDLLSMIDHLAAAPHPYTLLIVGTAQQPTEIQYQQMVKNRCAERAVLERVMWLGAVTQQALPQVLQKARAFLHTATNGSVDKAVLEALSCGLVVYSTAPVVAQLPGVVSYTGTLPERIESDAEGWDRHHYIVKEHSVAQLIPKILAHF